MGFRRKKSGPFWEQYNVRNILITYLQRFGGVRSSEPFHLFPDDAVIREDGKAVVRMYHPVVGKVAVRDPLSGSLEEVSRLEYLRQNHGRHPRNRLSNKERAGWKEPMLDFGAKHGWYFQVRWFPVDVASVFAALFRIYVDTVVPSIRLKLGRSIGQPGLAEMKHPYLFINAAGPNKGGPYRLASYRDAFKRAVEKIGLRHEKPLGTTPHGLRHAYAQDLQDAGLDPKMLQVCLHHKSPLSQLVYTRPTALGVSNTLEEASDKIKVHLTAPEELTAAEETLAALKALVSPPSLPLFSG